MPKPIPMLSFETITQEQIKELIERHNKQLESRKENRERFKEKHRELGDLCEKRKVYKETYYKKKFIENPDK